MAAAASQAASFYSSSASDVFGDLAAFSDADVAAARQALRLSRDPALQKTRSKDKRRQLQDAVQRLAELRRHVEGVLVRANDLRTMQGLGTWAQLFFTRLTDTGELLGAKTHAHMVEVLQVYLEAHVTDSRIRRHAIDLLSYLKSHAQDPDNALVGLRPSVDTQTKARRRMAPARLQRARARARSSSTMPATYTPPSMRSVATGTHYSTLAASATARPGPQLSGYRSVPQSAVSATEAAASRPPQYIPVSKSAPLRQSPQVRNRHGNNRGTASSGGTGGDVGADSGGSGGVDLSGGSGGAGAAGAVSPRQQGRPPTHKQNRNRSKVNRVSTIHSVHRRVSRSFDGVEVGAADITDVIGGFCVGEDMRAMPPSSAASAGGEHAGGGGGGAGSEGEGEDDDGSGIGDGGRAGKSRSKPGSRVHSGGMPVLDNASGVSSDERDGGGGGSGFVEDPTAYVRPPISLDDIVGGDRGASSNAGRVPDGSPVIDRRMGGVSASGATSSSSTSSSSGHLSSTSVTSSLVSPASRLRRSVSGGIRDEIEQRRAQQTQVSELNVDGIGSGGGGGGGGGGMEALLSPRSAVLRSKGELTLESLVEQILLWADLESDADIAFSVKNMAGQLRRLDKLHVGDLVIARLWRGDDCIFLFCRYAGRITVGSDGDRLTRPAVRNGPTAGGGGGDGDSGADGGSSGMDSGSGRDAGSRKSRGSGGAGPLSRGHRSSSAASVGSSAGGVGGGGGGGDDGESGGGSGGGGGGDGNGESGSSGGGKGGGDDDDDDGGNDDNAVMYVYTTPDERRWEEVEHADLCPLSAEMKDALNDVRTMARLVYDPAEALVQVIYAEVKTRTHRLLESRGVQVDRMHTISTMDVTLFDLNEVKEYQAIIQGLLDEPASDFRTKLERDLRERVDQFLLDIDRDSMFVPTREQSIAHMRDAKWAHLSSSRLHRYLGDCESALDQLKLEKRRLMNGERKEELTTWWLGVVAELTDTFLRGRGYDFSAIPEDYIRKPPASMAAVAYNLRIVRQCMQGAETSMHSESGAGDNGSADGGGGGGAGGSGSDGKAAGADTSPTKADGDGLNCSIDSELSPRPVEDEAGRQMLALFRSVNEVIYPRIRSFVDQARIVVGEEFDIEVPPARSQAGVATPRDERADERFLVELETQVDKRRSELNPEVVEWTEDMALDIRYLQQMEDLDVKAASGNMPSMQSQQGGARTDVVPISGLVLGRLARYENELRTIGETWHETGSPLSFGTIGKPRQNFSRSPPSTSPPSTSPLAMSPRTASPRAVSPRVQPRSAGGGASGGGGVGGSGGTVFMASALGQAPASYMATAHWAGRSMSPPGSQGSSAHGSGSTTPSSATVAAEQVRAKLGRSSSHDGTAMQRVTSRQPIGANAQRGNDPRWQAASPPLSPSQLSPEHSPRGAQPGGLAAGGAAGWGRVVRGADGTESPTSGNGWTLAASRGPAQPSE